MNRQDQRAARAGDILTLAMLAATVLLGAETLRAYKTAELAALKAESQMLATYVAGGAK